MTSVARILLAAGLLVAVVTAAPQQPTHPLSGAQSPSSVTPSSPSFSQPHASDDSSKEVSPSEHEAEDTQNDEPTTIAPTRFNPQSSFDAIHRQTRGVTPQATSNEDSDAAITTTEKPQRLSPGLSFGTHRQTRGVTPQSGENDGDTVTTTQGPSFHPLSSFSNSNNRQTRSSTFPEQAPISPHSSGVPVSSFSQGGSTGVNPQPANSQPAASPVGSRPDSGESQD